MAVTWGRIKEICETSGVLSFTYQDLLDELDKIGVNHGYDTEEASDEQLNIVRAILFRHSHPKQASPPASDYKPHEWIDPVIERLVVTNTIMIDTCSFMHNQCGKIIQEFLPALKKHKKAIIIPQKVAAELEKLNNDKTDSVRARAAEQGIIICQKLHEEGCLEIRSSSRESGEGEDNFADNVFFVSFSRYRSHYQMLLITQDWQLTHDVLQLNLIHSSAGFPVRVMRITDDGGLAEADLNAL